MYIAGDIMNNWIYLATYQPSNTEVRTLPQTFTELFITNSINHLEAQAYNNNFHFIIPRITIPDVASVEQALTLVDYNYPLKNVLHIWSGGLMMLNTYDYCYYDIYYR